MNSIRILTLKMMVKDVDNSNEKLASGGTLSTCTHTQKLALLGPAGCSQYVIVHFVTDVHALGRTAR